MRRAGVKRISLFAALVVGCVSLGCAKPEGEGARLRIVSVAGSRPDELRLTWIGGGRILLENERVPVTARPVAVDGGEEIATALIAVGGELPAERAAVVRGLLAGAVISEGALRVVLERPSQEAIIKLIAGQRPDGDGDGVPDEIDPCPGAAGLTCAPGPGVDASVPAADAASEPRGPGVSTLDGGSLDAGVRAIVDAGPDRSAPPGSGTLKLAQAAAPTMPVTLTGGGNGAWAHWGYPQPGSVNQSAGAMSFSSRPLPGTELDTSADGVAYTWSDGAPTAAATTKLRAAAVGMVGTGWAIVVPADTTTRTLSLHVSGWSARGRLSATLSDGSAAPVSDTFDPGPDSEETRFVVTFAAGLAEQALTITWTLDALEDPNGDIRLQAATLR